MPLNRLKTPENLKRCESKLQPKYHLQPHLIGINEDVKILFLKSCYEIRIVDKTNNAFV